MRYTDAAALFGRVRHAMGGRNDRPWLRGIIFRRDGDDITSLASDGHRLARFRAPLPAEAGLGSTPVMLPAEHVAHTLDLLDHLRRSPPEVVGFRFGAEVDGRPTRLSLDGGRAGRMEMALTKSEFVDWDRVIPRGAEAIVTLNRKLAARDFKALAQDAGKLRIEGAALAFAPTKLTATVGGIRGGTTAKALPARTSPGLPEGFALGVNPAYLADALRVCESEEVELWVNTAPWDPLMLKDPASPEYLALMMPVRADLVAANRGQAIGG